MLIINDKICDTLSFTLEPVELNRLANPSELIDGLPEIRLESHGALVASLHDSSITPLDLDKIPYHVTDASATYIKTRKIDQISDGQFTAVVTAANRQPPPRTKEVRFVTAATDLGTHIDPILGRVEIRDDHPVSLLYFPFGSAAVYIARVRCEVDELNQFTQSNRNYARIEAELTPHFNGIVQRYDVQQGDILAMNIHGRFVGEDDAIYPIMHRIDTTSSVRGVIRSYRTPGLKMPWWRRF